MLFVETTNGCFLRATDVEHDIDELISTLILKGKYCTQENK